MEQARRPSRSRERETEEDLLFFFFCLLPLGSTSRGHLAPRSPPLAATFEPCFLL